MREPVVIVVDTREQRPYEFDGAPKVVRTLGTGDYSVAGLETEICVERKSKLDAYGTFGRGRERFVRELERMAAMDYAAIVVESSLAGMLQPPALSRVHPKSVIGSLLSWSVRYRVHVFFADDRRHGEALTLAILRKCAEEKWGQRGRGGGSERRSSHASATSTSSSRKSDSEGPPAAPT